MRLQTPDCSWHGMHRPHTIVSVNACMATSPLLSCSLRVVPYQSGPQPVVVCALHAGNGKFTEAVSEDIVFMLVNNMFRALPPTRTGEQDSYDMDEEEPNLEAAWPHLQVKDMPCHIVLTGAWVGLMCTQEVRCELRSSVPQHCLGHGWV